MIKGNKAKYTTKLDRWDIYNNLPTGAQTKLSKQLNVSNTTVSNVLKGLRSDKHGIIKAAEQMAAVNIWKTRFCKLGKSQL